MGFNHIKKNYSGKTGVVFKIARKIPLPPVPGGLSERQSPLNIRLDCKTV